MDSSSPNRRFATSCCSSLGESGSWPWNTRPPMGIRPRATVRLVRRGLIIDPGAAGEQRPSGGGPHSLSGRGRRCHDGAVRIARVVVVLAGAACMLTGPSLAIAHASAAHPLVISLKLTGVVDPFEASYISGGISAAEGQGADAVLLTIDTPGGLDSSMRKIVESIQTSPIPVICYVSPPGARAAAAGTFIMEGCPVAAMAPGTEIGAAHPVGVSGIIEPKKATNDAAAFIRGLAQKYNRNAGWAVRAVRDAISASADEALRLHVIDLEEPTTTALLDAVDGKAMQIAGADVVLHTRGAVLEDRGLGVGAAILHGLLSPDLAFIFFYLGLGLIVAGILHHPVALIFG